MTDARPRPEREPMFNVPVVVTVMAAALLALHGVRTLLADDADQWLLLALAFIPDRYVSAPQPWPGGAVSAYLSPLTHMLVHGDWAHVLLNVASLLAFGGVLARRLGALRFTAFTAVTGLAGAFCFWLLNPELTSPMIGASGAISGMMAGALRLMFSAIDEAPRGMAGDAIRRFPHLIPLMSLAAALNDRRILTATGIWLALNALGAFGLATPAQAGTIAWEAHIGGYFMGLLGLGWFDRPAVGSSAEADNDDPAPPPS
jgi:membrane associated rhomboid family serine protease